MNTPPDSTKYTVVRIRDMAYVSDLPRYKEGKIKHTEFMDVKADFKNEFILGALACLPNDANNNYSDVVKNIKSGTPITFNAVPFGKGEWIYMPD